MPSSAASKPPPRIQIEDPQPVLDCGRYPVKACVGDRVAVSALVFRDGHDLLCAVVRYRGPDAKSWSEAPMRRADAEVGGDRWSGSFEVADQGRWQWTVEAWTDAEATWRDELRRKIAAGQPDLSAELAEGAVLLRSAAARAKGADRKLLAAAAAELDDGRHEAAFAAESVSAAERHPDRSRSTRMATTAEVEVDRPRARFGAWYELFPRSFGGLAAAATP